MDFLQSRLGFMSLVNLLCHKFALRKFILLFLCLVYGDKSVHMIEIACTNIQSKTKINGLLIFYPVKNLTQFSTLILLHITVAEVLAIFINADGRIKGVQIGDHKTKQ